ncbi:myb/SANT-like DNA-binding domain-containing protein 7 [Malaclemys terrapin pileata]|uniref:myb/SANT-like DNA-binding domain-containing protein 7 n=1 Tax=Malaclemys terrapin pileata TaxID=2991368 RepID=UPI0023A8F5D9|nr:myb/SANT-like DNA-binding domain-containing protein 7 [Malaclemys terrapin pileata]
MQSSSAQATIFAKISKGMMDRGYNRDTQQCRVKVKELSQAYQKIKDANGHSGSEPHTCWFYDELHAILRVAPTTTPPLSMDTCKGGVSCNRGEEFEDEEEVEDSAQQASRESLLPGSQELFITLEPIPSQPSQGGLPDREAREGTSDANVSMLPLSSPSQRLMQIRR